MADVSMIVNKGLEKMTDFLAGVVSVAPGWVGWGTGTTPPVSSNTDLEIPAAEARTVGTKTQETTVSTKDTFKIVALITCVSTAKAITEVAVFDALTGGNMFLIGKFDTISVNAGDSITFTIRTVFDQA